MTNALITLATTFSSVSAAWILPKLGVCYSPFHLAEYPLHGGWPGGIPAGIDADFAQMSKFGYTTVRTFYSNYYGYDVAPIAAKYNMDLYLGVFMTNEAWYQGQIDSAVNAVKAHPKTVKAILVGNENVAPHGPYSVDFLVAQMKLIRDRIKTETGLTIHVGTVQRTPEWLSRDPKMLVLGNNADVIGVNIYPFFDANSDPFNSIESLEGTWQAMTRIYPENKLRITETGWPTAGAPSVLAPQNFPNITNAAGYHLKFLLWMKSKNRQGDFWYNMYDSRPDEILPIDIEYHFGILTHDRKVKAGMAPLPASTTPQLTPVSTPFPTPFVTLNVTNKQT
ncbi:Aste57867_25195 [Aphanomyces stellatus]|uniref:glucan endo-1,3-beta-D-glucosidase n=1 Tax=Aphanomyces stellatus TaxID=120398 RepID=A0A485LTV1_9STRA|nr:hypothetical protein As57867_025117 [Aphanomyces stellatus]VFU01822.1 Aste57867_25195 [Aphanomyces stellatus]